MAKLNSDKVIDIMLKVNRTGRKGIEVSTNIRTWEKISLDKHRKIFPYFKQTVIYTEMMDRFYFSQAIESIRCFEEGVIDSVSDANVGSILGWGFPKSKGGTIKFVNDYGISKFMDKTSL